MSAAERRLAVALLITAGIVDFNVYIIVAGKAAYFYGLLSRTV